MNLKHIFSKKDKNGEIKYKKPTKHIDKNVKPFLSDKNLSPEQEFATASAKLFNLINNDTFYSKEVGLKVLTDEELTLALYNYLKQRGNYTGDFQEFKASNWHLLFQTSFIPFMVENQFNTNRSIAHLFNYWLENVITINNSGGASVEGFLGDFLKFSPKGVLMIDHLKDPTNLTYAGAVSFYFDDVDFQFDSTTGKIVKNQVYDNLCDILYRRHWLGMDTPIGDNNHQVDIYSSNGQLWQYKFFNLPSEQYQSISLEIRITYKVDTIPYSENDIITAIYEEFERTNYLGRGFYPSSFGDLSFQFPSLSSLKVGYRFPTTSGVDYIFEQHIPTTPRFKYFLKNTDIKIVVDSIS